MVQYDDNNTNNNNVDSMSPAELKAYYRGLKRGITLTFVTSTLREAILQNYTKYPQLRFVRGDPILVAQDLINATFVAMKQPMPTPQEISLYEITTQESGINILSHLMNLGTSATDKMKSTTSSKKQQQQQKKIPYDKEQAKKSKAFELSREQKEELK
jgi:hypothetical protein